MRVGDRVRGPEIILYRTIFTNVQADIDTEAEFLIGRLGAHQSIHYGRGNPERRFRHSLGCRLNTFVQYCRFTSGYWPGIKAKQPVR